MSPKDVVRRFIDEYQNGADEQAFAELLAPDVVDHSRPPGIAPGAEGVRQQFDGFRAALDGFRAEVLDMACEGDKVWTYKVFHGSRDGAPVRIAVIDIVRVRDGRIVEHWNVVDGALNLGCVTKVKLCGITRLDDAHAAAEAGAWAIGMIFVPESPRVVDLGAAEEIGGQLNRKCEVAGVFANAPLDELVNVAELCHLSLVQLHGDEGPSYAREAARRTGARVIKAVAAKDPATVRGLRSFHHVDFHLLDAYVPGMRGGTGKTFHWEYARHRDYKVPLILSGGINPDNVAEAIEAVEPYAVDTASGTESTPGIKDPAKITALMRAVRQADGVPEATEPEDPATPPVRHSALPRKHPVVRNPTTGDTVSERR